MDGPRFAEYQKHSTFRTPAWRWERGQQLVAEGCNYSPRRDDAETARVVTYVRTWNRCQPERRAEKMARDFPDLNAAHRLHEQGGSARLEAQARLLARQAPEVVAEHVHLPAKAIRSFEAIFFNITDRIDARDWISRRAIGWWSFDPAKGRDRATVFRSYAYWGGPSILEAVRPYLIDEEGLARLLAQAEAETPHERSIRLAILCDLLPWGEKTDKILVRMGLSMHEMAQTRSLTHPTHPIVSLTVDEFLEACAAHALLTAGRPFSPPSDTDVKPSLRKTG